MFYNLFLNDEFIYVIISNYITPDEYHLSKISMLKNCIFCNNIDELKYKISCFGAFLSTDTLATKAHQQALFIVNLCHLNNIPVIELQHGLFVYGMSYHCIPENNIVTSDSLPVSSFKNHTFTFYPTNKKDSTCIGYPIYYDFNKLSYKGKYTVILSNMHWMAYSEYEKFTFFSSIIELANKHPNELFIWKLHPGEIDFPYYKELLHSLFRIFPSSKRNIIFFHEDNILNKIGNFDLIGKSNKIICTLSTVMLDCELLKKDTIIFNCKSSDSMVSQLKTKECFSDIEELEKLYIKEKIFLKLVYYINSIATNI